jgi:hypothetical protein
MCLTVVINNSKFSVTNPHFPLEPAPVLRLRGLLFSVTRFNFLLQSFKTAGS